MKMVRRLVSTQKFMLPMRLSRILLSVDSFIFFAYSLAKKYSALMHFPNNHFLWFSFSKYLFLSCVFGIYPCDSSLSCPLDYAEFVFCVSYASWQIEIQFSKIWDFGMVYLSKRAEIVTSSYPFLTLYVYSLLMYLMGLGL